VCVKPESKPTFDLDQFEQYGTQMCPLNRHGPLFDHLVSAGEHQLSRLHETKHSRLRL
jgi:hypothetical protein